MIKKIIAFLIIIAIIIAAVTLVKKRKQAVADTPTAAVMLTTVEVYKPTVKEISESETFLATLQAVNQPQISSKISGYINKIYVKESQSVKKGELLIEIDNADIISSIESLKASQNASQQELSLAYKSLKRSKALFDIGGISRESYEMAQLSVENKKAKLITFDKNIKAKENLLTYTKIHAPIDGKIGTIFIKEGSLSAPGKPILEIVGEDKRLIFSYAPNTAIKVGQKVEVNGFIEKVTSLYQTSKNALLSAEIALQNDLNLPSGTSVDIKVIFKSEKGTVVPLNALLHDDGVSVMVYKENQFYKEKVEVVVENDSFAIISPAISEPVGVGSEAKLSALPAIQNIKVVFDGK
jgi:RND family efflux transporter MFP subunit